MSMFYLFTRNLPNVFSSRLQENTHIHHLIAERECQLSSVLGAHSYCGLSKNRSHVNDYLSEVDSDIKHQMSLCSFC